jgi:hypothetical protein
VYTHIFLVIRSGAKLIVIDRLYLHTVPGLQGKGGRSVTMFNTYYLGARVKAAEACIVEGVAATLTRYTGNKSKALEGPKLNIWNRLVFVFESVFYPRT